MKLDYLKLVKTLEDERKTDTEIAATLAADPRHKRDIMATGSVSPTSDHDLLHLLAADFEVLRIGSNATWKGPLVDYFEQPDVNAELKAGFELLLTQLQISNRPVFTHGNPKTGFLATALTQVVGQLHGDSAYVQARMDAITGGKIYAGVTEQDVTASRAEYQSRVDIDTLNSDWAALQNEGGINSALSLGDRAALVIALRAAADSLEAS
jgi:hypothetical protein